MSKLRVIATGLEFPEGPVVMPDGSVVLVEIRAQKLTRVYPDGRKETVAKIPGGPNGAAIGPDGKCYICNNGGFSWSQGRGALMPGAPAPSEYLGGSLQRVDLATGKIETLFERCGERKLNGPNDLVFDKQGGLWFSDLGKRRARDMDVGSVYYMKPGGSDLVEAVPSMLPANGIGLSPDEKTVYVAETPTSRLWAFDVGAPGEIKPGPVIYRGEIGRPLAGLGGYQMFELARGGSIRQCLRSDADLRLHFGDCTGWQAGRAGADWRPCHHQYRFRRAGIEDRLHHIVGQGRTGGDGLAARRPAAELPQQVGRADDLACSRHAGRAACAP